MKLVEMKCKNCGAILKVDDEAKEATCTYCNASFKIDDEVHHIQYDNAEQAGYEFEKGRIKAQQEIADEAKRKEEEEKQKAAEEQQRIREMEIQQEKLAQERVRLEEEKKKKRKHLVLWIIGWIFFFPIPLSVLIWRKDWDKKVRIAVIVTIWLVVLIYFSTDIGGM